MHDPWTDKLSDYIDGALDISEARQVELHLSSCDACAATLHELEAVVAVARSLEPREPARDLWAGIAAGIGATASGDVRPADRDIVSIADRRPRAARSFTFTMPQLAAAAVLLMTISASAVWMATRDASTGDVAVAMQGTILQNAAPVTAPVRLVDSRAAAEDEEYRSLAALL
jgi:anti-sigma factor RsiW